MEYAHGRFEPRLEVAQHPPRKWFMAGAHNSDHFTFKVVLRMRYLMRGLEGVLPLRVQLLYDNGYPVEDQSIAQWLEKPRMFLEHAEVTLKVGVIGCGGTQPEELACFVWWCVGRLVDWLAWLAG